MQAQNSSFGPRETIRWIFAESYPSNKKSKNVRTKRAKEYSNLSAYFTRTKTQILRIGKVTKHPSDGTVVRTQEHMFSPIGGPT